MFSSLITLDQLILSKQRIQFANNIKNPSAFLELFKCHELACFLFSLFISKDDFNLAFPDADQNYFNDAFKKEWATQIRFDTIRNQLNSTFKSHSIEHLFLDFTLRNRAINSNRLLISEKIIKILFSDRESLQSAISVIQEQGFRRIIPSAKIKAKIAHRIDKNPKFYFFKRNEFIVNLNLGLPCILNQHLDYKRIFNESDQSIIQKNEIKILSEKDEFLFCLLNLNDSLLFDRYYLVELLIANIILSRNLSLPELEPNIKNQIERLQSFVNDIFGRASKLDQPYTALVKNPSLRKKINLWNNKMKILDLLRIILELRYY